MTIIVNPISFSMCLIAGFLLITLETCNVITQSTTTFRLAVAVTIVFVLLINNVWRMYSICRTFDSMKATEHEIPKTFVLITGVFLFSWISSFALLQLSKFFDYPFVITMTGVHLNAMIGVYLESKEVLIRMMPFLLFWYKVYAVVAVVCGIVGPEDNWYYSGYLPIVFYRLISYVLCLCGFVIWWKCRSIERRMMQHSTMYSDQIAIQHSADHATNAETARSPKWQSLRNLSELSEAAKQFWENKTFLAQNMMIVMNCILTFLGVVVSYLRTPKETDEYGDDNKYRALERMEFIGICCGVIIVTSIWSVVIRRFECRCSAWLPVDSDFRFLCLEKTALLLFKQTVVSGANSSQNNFWAVLFTILSMFSLFSIATITWAFDRHFIDTMRSKRVNHAKLLYTTYGT